MRAGVVRLFLLCAHVCLLFVSVVDWLLLFVCCWFCSFVIVVVAVLIGCLLLLLCVSGCSCLSLVVVLLYVFVC